MSEDSALVSLAAVGMSTRARTQGKEPVAHTR
jgi:hypothetical protein